MAEGWVLGIESTAHTFSFGLVDSNGIPRPSVSKIIRPTTGGIHPREAADHHVVESTEIFSKILADNDLLPSDISVVAYSQGPGMGACLRTGAAAARAISSHLNVPLIGVNHCVAHIEIGRQQCGCEDPILLYVSGGNTQVIARLDGRYRVLGETLDIGIGNMLDKFAREQGIPFPGGPKIEQLANQWLDENPNPSLEGLELPYAVQGIDLAFSGILNAALNLVEKGKTLPAVCWSLQEHAFAACVEVAERAMAHAGKSELLLGGGVACNERLRDMCNTMSNDRMATSHVPIKPLCVDNGSMIATLGRLQLLWGEPTRLESSGVKQDLRTDETPILWN
mgnify:CR=1 FL=1